MSMVHSYYIGHFDPYAFRSLSPAVLKPVDDVRAQSLLQKIAGTLPEEHQDRAFSIADGLAVCVWSSLIRWEVGREFAYALARAEGCLVMDVPGWVMYPAESVWRLPGDSEPLTPESAEQALAADDVMSLRAALHRATLTDRSAGWAQAFCGRLTRHPCENVRGNAMFALERLARRGHQPNRARVQPLIEGGMADAHTYVRRQAEAAAQEIETALKWVFPAFDNGKPEEKVSTYSNGWVRCPSCGWRFATYDPWAFREGRCMTCRQRLRIV
jgi:hypothetical protein